MSRALLRPKAAWTRLAVGRTTFYEKFVATGRIRLVHLSNKISAAIEEDVERVIDELIAERDANPPVPRPPIHQPFPKEKHIKRATSKRRSVTSVTR